MKKKSPSLKTKRNYEFDPAPTQLHLSESTARTSQMVACD